MLNTLHLEGSTTLALRASHVGIYRGVRRLFAVATTFLACAALSPIAAAQQSMTMAQPTGNAPHWPVVKEGKTIKITPHVYVIPDEHVPQVPNVGIIVGSKATLIVDPGMGVASGEAIAREVAKVSKNADVYIVNTHFHPEHTTGDAAFPKAKILRAAAQQQDVEEMGMKWVGTFSERSANMAKVLEGATFRKPDEVFEKDKTLDLGGVRVRMLRLGPGHTRGDTVMYVEGDGVMFSGDLAMRNIFPAFSTPQSSARTWLTSLDEMDRFKAARVVPAHGDLTDASVVDAYRGFLKTLQVRVGELKRDGKTAKETAELLQDEFKGKYPAWAQPIRVHPAVMVVYFEQP
jgi:glyoxylase-like metal-dependent hydrolase (beta-lactamase superfamily II)